MNISLSTAGKKKKGALGYGLNDRKDNNNKKSSSNVFGDDDDDDNNDDDNGFPSSSGNNRKTVNEQIALEQAALRRRAQAALISVEDPSVYDYDGAYASFKNNNNDDTTQKSNKERKSKYISDLLMAAKVRERERDAIYERKVAREQAEEDAKEEYAGKEKFVTKAYKLKLEERKIWAQEQEEKERQEVADDVTKKSAGAAFASFYGNLNKNVSVGGGAQKSDVAAAPPKETLESLDDFDPRLDFLGGFERSTAEDDNVQGPEYNRNTDNIATGTSSFRDPAGEDVQQQKEPQLSMRERREKKVAEARIRYFKRKAAMLDQ